MPASQGRPEPGATLIGKAFSETTLLAEAGPALDGHFPGSGPVPS